MLLRMVMFLEVSLPMVRNVLVNSTKKMGTMILRLRVKARLKVWLMPMMLRKMEHNYLFQNIFYRLRSLLQSKLYVIQ